MGHASSKRRRLDLPQDDVFRRPQSLAERFVSFITNSRNWRHRGRMDDVVLRIVSGQGLPPADLHGLSDPYVVLYIGDGEETIQYKTAVSYNTLTPSWQCEELHLQHVFPGCPLLFEVWDKDHLKRDDYMCSVALTWGQPEQYGPPAQWSTHSLPLKTKSGRDAGQLTLQLHWQPSTSPRGHLMHCGPARYRIALSAMAGQLLGTNREGLKAFAAYKVRLAGVKLFFPGGNAQPWNRDYDKAKQIFTSTILMTGIKSQHSLLYADSGNKGDLGLLSCEQDLMQLLGNGTREGQLRYFTYVLMEDSLRFSETGAAFLVDMMSKHAMHSGCAEKVICAGEFVIVPSPARPGHFKLVFDNNSGTYAPPASLLPAVRDLLCYNIQGLEVELVSTDDPLRMKAYQDMVPSR